MKDLFFVVSLSLLAFGLINSLLSFLIALVARWVQFECQPRARARRYLLVRAFPGAASILFVGAFFVPVLCRSEPGNADERVSLAMSMLAAAALMIPVSAIVRGLRSTWDTYRLSTSWQASALPFKLKEFPLPAFLIEAPFPVVSVVGIFEPHLFVARNVLTSCSTEEFDAILSHECAHIRHRDNLFRLIQRLLPDLLAWTPVASRLGRGWAQACEEAADDEAVAAGKGLALASALCKVARLARGHIPAAAIGILGDGDVAHRLERLLRPERTATPVSRGRFDQLRFAMLLALPLIWASTELSRVHAFTEALVHLLK